MQKSELFVEPEHVSMGARIVETLTMHKISSETDYGNAAFISFFLLAIRNPS